MGRKEEKASDDIYEYSELIKPAEKSKLVLAIEALVYVAFIVLMAAFMIVFVVQRTDVVGHSMESTLEDKDSLLVDKISYRFRDPERFEIVVFRYLYQERTHYIKRVIGLPGETVQIVDGVIYINGSPLEESYGLEKMKDPGLAGQAITLGEDEYFLLGDNRNHSTDSRSPDVANVSREQMIGRAWLRIWPLKKIEFVD